MTVVAVLGAGDAGVTMAARLERSLPRDVELVVVNDDPHHLVQHELHRAVRRPGILDALRVPLRDVLDRARVVVDRVESIDPDAGRVTLRDGDAITYEYAGVCLGAETAYHGLPGVEAHATPLKRPAHARRIREDFLGLPPGGRVVVGGAGLSGVQVAGELAALRDERGLDASVVLVERLDDVVPGFDADFRAAVRDALDAAGVDVRTDVPVASASRDAIEVDGTDSIAYDQLVWTGGIRGASALGGERPTVPATMRLGAGTFALGDAARVIDRDGAAVPASAQAAIAEARVAARNVRRLVEHDRDPRGPFEPRLDPVSFSPRGWIVSVGDGTVAQVGPAVVRGTAALALKATAGVGYLAEVGAVREAVDLVVEEFGGDRDPGL